MAWIIAAIIFLLFLFLPLSMKLTFLYQDRKVHIYFFNYNLKIKEKVSQKEANVKNAKKATRFIDRFLPRDIQTTLLNLNKNKFKPKIKMKLEINYGFEDAALTGVSCGIFHGFSPVMYELFGFIFKVTSYEYIVNPQFNNPMLNFRISSIISINLAKIIYMLFIIFLK